MGRQASPRHRADLMGHRPPRNPLAARTGLGSEHTMAKVDAPEPQYQGPVGGAYTTEEHLKAQNEQLSASDGKPLNPDAENETPTGGKHDAPQDPPK